MLHNDVSFSVCLLSFVSYSSAQMSNASFVPAQSMNIHFQICQDQCHFEFSLQYNIQPLLGCSDPFADTNEKMV